MLLQVGCVHKVVYLLEHPFDDWPNEDGHFGRDQAIDGAGHEKWLDRTLCIVGD